MTVSSSVEAGERRFRAELALADRPAPERVAVTRAYTAFVVCAGRTRLDGADKGLHQTTWTERGGKLVTEIRGSAATLSSSRVAEMMEPILGAFASGTLDAARLLGPHAKVGMTVNVATRRTDAGHAVLRVVMQGRSSPVPHELRYGAVAPQRLAG